MSEKELLEVLDMTEEEQTAALFRKDNWLDYKTECAIASRRISLADLAFRMKGEVNGDLFVEALCRIYFWLTDRRRFELYKDGVHPLWDVLLRWYAKQEAIVDIVAAIEAQQIAKNKELKDE